MATQEITVPATTLGTFFDLLMEVDGIHRGSDDVGLAVAGSHDPSNLIHELHGDTCEGKQRVLSQGSQWDLGKTTQKSVRP